MVKGHQDQYRDRLLTIIAVVAAVGALRVSYPIAMPLAFAGLIVGAVWPLKHWLDRWMPSWLSYALSILALIAVLAGFAAAVYLSLSQVIAVLGNGWPAVQNTYEQIARWAAERGLPLGRTMDQRRVVGLLEMLAASIYQFATYTGFIGLLVILGLPEVPRLRGKMRDELETRKQSEFVESIAAVSAQIRRYLGTTLATSILTGVASSVWALATGLDLALVWGLLNFLLNFIPLIGNIVGIIPPVLYAMVQFHGAGMPLLVFAGFAMLQIAISNFVYPILQGRQLSLSPLAIIVAMTFWGWMWGLAGMLLAVPLTAAMVIVCSHVDRTRWIAKILSA